MARWAMVIDVTKCIGCETCKQVCCEFNPVPPNATWRQVFAVGLNGDRDDPSVFFSIGCMHCENPSCVSVCPTGASQQRTDGIVTIDADRCVGCGACVLACPYDARKIATEDKMPPEIVRQPKATSGRRKDRIGVCTKCHFCAPILDDALKQGLKPGIDDKATPMCVRHCIAEAIVFGDLDDPQNEVARIVRENKTRRLNEGLDTGPCVFYIVE